MTSRAKQLSKPSRRSRRVERPTPLSRSLAPLHTVRRLRYLAQFSDTGTGGVTPVVKQFRLNDCYDPDYTGTGHQPMGFDQMMAFYSTFRVLSTDVHIMAQSYAAAAANNPQPAFNGIVGFFARANDTLAVSTLTQAMEQPSSRYIQLSNAVTGTINEHYDVAEYFGITRQQLIADNEFIGTAAGSPARWLVGSLFIAAASPGIYTTVINTTVMLELEVRFEGPLILATS